MMMSSIIDLTTTVTTTNQAQFLYSVADSVRSITVTATMVGMGTSQDGTGFAMSGHVRRDDAQITYARVRPPVEAQGFVWPDTSTISVFLNLAEGGESGLDDELAVALGVLLAAGQVVQHMVAPWFQERSGGRMCLPSFPLFKDGRIDKAGIPSGAVAPADFPARLVDFMLPPV